MTAYTGEVCTLPPDKSIAHRAALIGALAEGTTEIANFSGGFDNQSTLGVLEACGVDILQENVRTPAGDETRRVVINSQGLWSLKQPKAELMCNNSGSTMRMMAGILAAQSFRSTLVGDSSLMKRPMLRVAHPLRMMGADIVLSPDDTAPVTIQGTRDLQAIEYPLPVPSAQVKSLVTFAALHADGESRIIETRLSRNHTELMLGLNVEKLPDGRRAVLVPGRRKIPVKPFHIPGDSSAACFLVALGLLNPGSEILLKEVCLNPTRVGYLDVLLQAGAEISLDNVRDSGGEKIGDVLVRHTPSMTPLHISDRDMVANCIDEIPMLAVLSACATGEFALQNAAELRAKESDRISALTDNLKRLGYVCEEFPDGFVVRGKNRTPAGKIVIDSYHDHRIAMSFAVANTALSTELELSDAEIIGVSFPNFFQIIESLAS